MVDSQFILSGATVVTANADWKIFFDGAVVVNHDTIVAIGTSSDISEKYKDIRMSIITNW